MYLVTAATKFEMEPFLETSQSEGVTTLITGVGPVETTLRLTSFLSGYTGELKGVINFGVGGAYVDPETGTKADLLDICLAAREVLGDFGVCLDNQIERITEKELEVVDTFFMDRIMLDQASLALQRKQISFHKGNFVTVNCTTGTAARGTMLARQYEGLCENMEGAAAARVCQEFDLPCLEVRCISNLVEDRDKTRWKLKQACRRSGEAASMIVSYLLENSHE